MAHAGHGVPAPPGNGLVWVYQPVLFHSSRDTSVNDYSTLTPAEFALINTHFRNWYTSDWVYGLGTIYFFCAGIGAFMLINLFSKYRYRRAASNKQTPISFLKLISFYRFLTSKSYRIRRLDYYSPTLGAMLIVGSAIIFFFTWMFAVKPYYWPSPAMGGSPPIATRAGWVAVGMMPFLFAFAAKYNLVGLITGVSHEKLQVLHRWTAWFMYFATLLHTFPFIIIHRDAGDIQAEWKGKIWYWTGVAALLPQTWLVVMSWGPIRNRYYETFKKLHYLAGIIFFFFLFIHCNFRLTSWDYLIATGAICLLTFTIRFGGMLFINGLNHTATFETIDERMIRVTIPTTIQWKPGQHFFVRFCGMGIHAWTSHPFTVSSEPQSQYIEFYIRVRDGVTSRLAAFAQSSRTSRVLLDGPYGTHGADLTVYDRVVLVGGGSGLTSVLSNMRHLVRQQTNIVCKQVHVVWVTPYYKDLEPFRGTFDQALEATGKNFLGINVYVTRNDRPSSPESEKDKESEKTGVGAGVLRVTGGRPQLRDIVQEHCSEPGSIAFIACGPDSLAYDMRYVVADCQLDVATGNAKQKDIFLHVESFGW